MPKYKVTIQSVNEKEYIIDFCDDESSAIADAQNLFFEEVVPVIKKVERIN